MNDPTLISDLIRAGVSAELVGRVANTIAAIVRDNVRDIVKEYERERKREQRKNPIKSGGKQTMSAPILDTEGSQNVPDSPGQRCDLTSFLSSSSEDPTEVQRRTERKKEEQAKRGTRLPADAKITSAHIEFAIREGFTEGAARRMWAEFVDYWQTPPGQRGVKLNWFKTWCVRVRSVKDTRGTNGPKDRNPTMDAFDRLIDRAGGEEIADDVEAIDITPNGTKGG